MIPEKPNLFLEKAVFLKQAGLALIAVALIFLTFLSTAPGINVPWIGFYSYLLLGAGAILIASYKGIAVIQNSRLKKLSAYCLECGWFGRGDDWHRSDCCPECDSDKVSLR